MDLDRLFKNEGITDVTAKSFWPNICCKERNDDDKSKTLEKCEPPKGSNIKRENIIPFALSQGGNYTRHNLYVEVSDKIKKHGYFHEGMKKLLQLLGRSKTKRANKLVDSFFNEVSLCGPRIVDEPGAKDKKKLCELFIPYQHSMTQFYNLIELLFVNPMKVQDSSSFLETIESSLRKRQLTATKTRLGKNTNTNMHQIMQTKPVAAKPKAEQQCKHTGAGATTTSGELAEWKKSHCTGYKHIDLSNTDVKNIAIYYLQNDLLYDNKKMLSLKHTLRYDVNDDSCPAAPLFTANDISVQQVNMDTKGKAKEWVAVVNLNTQDKNGYLQSELPNCKVKDYLIGAKIQVKAFVDGHGCCDGWKDYGKCSGKAICTDKLIEMKDKRDKHFSKDVRVTGTYYEVKNTYDDDVKRRRRLSGKDDLAGT
jgi:hypothetical protein